MAAILDLFSRRVVGFAMSDRIDRQLALDALRAAVGRRLPNAGLVHISDRGSQYASDDYQDAFDEAGVVCSMSRKGNCWDNAVAESFFATLKTELVYLSSRRGLRRERRSSSSSRASTIANVFTRPSGYLSPVALERMSDQEKLRGSKKAA